jgi:hypothetical protein
MPVRNGPLTVPISPSMLSVHSNSSVSSLGSMLRGRGSSNPPQVNLGFLQVEDDSDIFFRTADFASYLSTPAPPPVPSPTFQLASTSGYQPQTPFEQALFLGEDFTEMNGQLVHGTLEGFVAYFLSKSGESQGASCTFPQE